MVYRSQHDLTRPDVGCASVRRELLRGFAGRRSASATQRARAGGGSPSRLNAARTRRRDAAHPPAQTHAAIDEILDPQAFGERRSAHDPRLSTRSASARRWSRGEVVVPVPALPCRSLGHAAMCSTPPEIGAVKTATLSRANRAAFIAIGNRPMRRSTWTARPARRMVVP